LRRQHHIPLALPLAAFDPERHAPAGPRTRSGDVRHLQLRDLRHAKAGAVTDAERGSVFEARRRLDETRHLVLAQDGRHLARPLHRRRMPDEIRPVQRDLEEKPQRAAGLDGRRADTLLREMQLAAAKVLGGRLGRRTAEAIREVLHRADLVPLGVLAEPARRHGVDHAPAQCSDRLGGHRESSCPHGVEPHDPQTDASPPVIPSRPAAPAVSAPLPRERFRFYGARGETMAPSSRQANDGAPLCQNRTI
jgi:hypothetical protein